MPTALFESKVAVADFRELFGSARTESTLHKQWLDVCSGPADSGSFLLPRTLVVLRRKPSPGAEMLRGREHGHIHSDFRNDATRSKVLDTRRRHNEFELRKIFLSSRQNQRFQIELAQLKAIHVRTDDAELFSLFFTHLSIHSSKDFFIRCFHASGAKTRNICDFSGWIFQQASRDCGGCFTKDIGNDIVQFDIGDSKAVLCPVFSSVVKLVSLQR